MIDWMTRDPYAEARAFYGHAFPAMLEWQGRLAKAAQCAALVTNDLIDDVARQAPLMGKQEVMWSLMLSDRYRG